MCSPFKPFSQVKEVNLKFCSSLQAARYCDFLFEDSPVAEQLFAEIKEFTRETLGSLIGNWDRMTESDIASVCFFWF